MASISPSVLFVLLIALSLFKRSSAHGLLNDPAQRGNVGVTQFVPFAPAPRGKFPRDTLGHYPAGDRNQGKGVAIKSQIKALGKNERWEPYNPTDPNYKWFAGVCGDLENEPRHLKPTEQNRKLKYKPNFYNNGYITRTYQQGDTVNFGVTINAHHNGFFEFHLCDVAKCGGDISKKCFQDGHCYKLERAYNEECDEKKTDRCGPKDERYPGRWYLPCTTVPEGEGNFEFYGGEEEATIQYKLPAHLSCEHCVLQWYWTAANTCNPPGVERYFTSAATKPNWNNCKGQNKARNGWTSIVKDCGSSLKMQHYPEQYLQCADVKIDKLKFRPESNETPFPRRSPTPTPTRNTRRTSPSPTPKENPMEEDDEKEPDMNAMFPYGKYNAERAMTQKSGAIRDIVLIGDNQRQVSLHKVNRVNLNYFRSISIEALTAPNASRKFGLRSVAFFLNGKKVGTRKGPGYFIFGKFNGRAKSWGNIPRNKWIQIRVYGARDTDKTLVKFVGKLRRK